MSGVRQKQIWFVEQRVGIYEAEVETYEHWQVEHRVSMACFEMQDLLAEAVGLYDRITRLLDGEWSAGRNSDEEHFDQRMEVVVMRWVSITTKTFELFDRLAAEYERRDFDVSKIKQLRECHDEANEMLAERELARVTPPNEVLLALARSSPPPQSWHDEDEPQL